MANLQVLASFNGSNGSDPYGSVLLDADGDLLGTTSGGGAYGDGTVFEIVDTGAGYAATPSTLVSFDGTDGSKPEGGLIADANGDLFGTTYGGGNGFLGAGTVFEVAKTGTGYASAPTVLANFGATDAGSYPVGDLVADREGDLIGTGSGTAGQGSVFEIAKTASGYASTATSLASFSNVSLGGLTVDANGDLFGATSSGGASGEGMVFEIAKVAAGYAANPTTLVSFNSADGSSPEGGMTLDANGDLFGTTSSGGASGDGTVFEIVKTASGYASTPTTLASFNGANGSSPEGGLTLDANGDLFGTTSSGGASGDGIVFEIAMTAAGYATSPRTLISFNGANGADPLASLTADAAGDLFGTSEQGGANGDGTAFEITGSGYVLPTSPRPVVTLAASPAVDNGQTAVLGTAAPGGNGDPLSVTLTTDSDFATGSTLVLSEGALVYAPGLITAADVGPDTLAYAVTDTVTGATSFETQTVTLSNGPPPVVTFATTPTASNGTSTTLGAAVGGFDDDSLSVTLNSDADFAAGSKIVLDDGNLVYSPGIVTAALVGMDTLKYTVADTVTGATTSETQTVTLSNGPAPVVTLATTPTASNSASATLGAAVAGFDGDQLKVTLNSDADFAAGSKLALNNGTLLYTPGLVTAALVGADTIDYSVTDTVTGAVTSEMQTVTLSNGPPPVVTLVPSPTATDAAPATLATAAPAYDNDPLGVTLVSDADFANGSSLVLNNGFLTYTPGTITAALIGTTDTLKYTVTDTLTGALMTETEAVTLSNGPAPVVLLVASPTATDAAPATLAAAAPGYNSDPLKVTLVSDADFATSSSLALNNGRLVYTPGTITPALSGTTDTLKYLVTDTVTGATTAETQKVTLSAASTLETYRINETYNPVLGHSSTFNGIFQFNASTNEITNISGTLYDTVYLEDIPLDPTTIQSTYYPSSGLPPETAAEIQTYSFHSPTSSDTFVDVFHLAIVTTNPTEEWSLPNNFLYTYDLTYGTQTVQSVNTYDITLLSPPAITGTVAGQTTTSEAPVKPFPIATISDANSGATDTLTITLSGSGGTLAGSGLVSKGSGVYMLTGAATTVTSELDALSFTPKAAWPQSSATTTFTLSDLSSAYATPAVDSTTTVTDNDPTGAISISAAYLAANIDGINADTNVTSITLTDTGTPVLNLTDAQATGDTTALGEITNQIFELLAPGLAPTYYVGGNGASGTALPLTASNSTVIERPNSNVSLTGSSDTVTTASGAASVLVVNGSSDPISAASGDIVNLQSGSGDTVTGTAFTVDASASTGVTVGGNTVSGNFDVVDGSNAVVGVLANSRVELNGSNDTVTVASGGASHLFVYGSNDTFAAATGDGIYLEQGTGDTVTGTGFTVNASSGTGVTVGGNTVSGNFDVVDGSNASVGVKANSRVELNGSNDTVTIASGGASHLFVYGSNDTISAATGDGIYLEQGTGDTVTGTGFTVNPFSGTGVTVGGNTVSGNFDVVDGSSAVVGVLANSRAELTGSSDTVTIASGAASHLFVYGSNDTIAAASGDGIYLEQGTGDTVTGTGFTVNASSGTGVTVGGNTVSGNFDVVDGSNAVVGVLANSRVELNGSNDAVTIASGGASHLFVYGSNDTIAAASGDGIYLEQGTGDTVTGTGFTVNASSGTGVTVGGNTVSGNFDVVDGSNAVVGVLANSRAELNGSNDAVTIASGGASHLFVYGSNDTISSATGDGIYVESGSDDTVTAGSDDTVSLIGTADIVYAGLNDSITDGGTGSLFKITGSVGGMMVSGFGADTASGVFDLLGGIGGYSSAGAAYTALSSDGHGGSLLSFGTAGSLDIAGVAKSSLSAANFKIG